MPLHGHDVKAAFTKMRVRVRGPRASPLYALVAPNAEPHLESEDSAADVAVNVEALSARGPFGEALFDEVVGTGVGGSAAQPVLEAQLETEALLVVKRKTGLATDFVKSSLAERGPMRRVAESLDLLGPGPSLGLIVCQMIQNGDDSTRSDDSRELA